MDKLARDVIPLNDPIKESIRSWRFVLSDPQLGRRYVIDM